METGGIIAFDCRRTFPARGSGCAAKLSQSQHNGGLRFQEKHAGLDNPAVEITDNSPLPASSAH